MSRILSVLLLTALPLLARAPECHLFEKIPAQLEGPRLVEYLSATEGHTNACVQYAILRLGALKYVGAIDVLVTYLDFTQPLPPFPQAVVSNGGDRPFPAATALMEIGKPALPALLKVAGKAGTSEMARKHAIDRVMGIFNNDAGGIAAFMKASRAAADPDVAARLAAAAKEAFRFCAPTEKPACAAILSEHP